jgi:hypothetical protein
LESVWSVKLTGNPSLLVLTSAWTLSERLFGIRLVPVNRSSDLYTMTPCKTSCTHPRDIGQGHLPSVPDETSIRIKLPFLFPSPFHPICWWSRNGRRPSAPGDAGYSTVFASAPGIRPRKGNNIPVDLSCWKRKVFSIGLIVRRFRNRLGPSFVVEQSISG